MNKSLYALYKADQFIDIGTVEQLAKLLNVKEETIRFYSRPVYQRRHNYKGWVVIRIKEKDEND